MLKNKYSIDINWIKAFLIIPLILFGFLRQYFHLPQSIILLYLLSGSIFSSIWLTQNFKPYILRETASIFVLFLIFLLAIIRNNGVYNDIIACLTAMTSVLIGFYSSDKTIEYIFTLLKILGLTTTLLVILDSILGIKISGINFRFQYLPSSFLQSQFTLLYFIDLQFSKKYAITIPIVILGITGLAMNFGRGSLLLTILLITMLSYRKAIRERNFLRLIILMLLLVAPTVIVINILISNGLFNFRIFNLINNIDSEPRLEVWNRFNLNDINILVGEGLSGYKKFYRTHPHNFMLQVFIDSGIIGILALILLIRKGILGFFHIHIFNNKLPYTLVVILFLYLANSFFSGNIYYNFALFFFLGSGMRLLVNKS